MTKKERIINIFIFSVCVSAAVFSLIRPEIASGAVLAALSLCATRVVPSIFLFMVCSKMIAKCSGERIFSKITAGMPEKLLGISGSGAAAVFLGMLSGYPTGAAVINEFAACGAMEREEADRLFPFVTAASPAFLIGSVSAMTGSRTFGAVLLFSQTLSALICIAVSGRKSEKTYAVNSRRKNVSPIAALVSSVKESGAAAITICSFITFFSVFSEMAVCFLPDFAKSGLAGALISGLLEISCGFSKMAGLERNVYFYAAGGFILGFSGFSVFMQSADTVCSSGLNMEKYFKGKVLQSALCALISAGAGTVCEKYSSVSAGIFLGAEHGKIEAIWEIILIFVFVTVMVSLFLYAILKFFTFFSKK